jgi:hypothetical protein
MAVPAPIMIANQRPRRENAKERRRERQAMNFHYPTRHARGKGILSRVGRSQRQFMRAF